MITRGLRVILPVLSIFSISELTRRYSDVLSHYKELEEKESTGYLVSHAVVHNQTVIEAADALVKRISELFDRVEVVLGDGEALSAFRSTMAGHAQFHLQSERYKLAEILPKHYYES